MTVTVDWSPVERAVPRLADNIDQGSRRVALEAATATATEIRAALPKRTGALAASVGVEPAGDGAAVTYGAGLRYGRFVEARTHTLRDAVDSGRARFEDAETAMAAREVQRL